MVLGSVRVLSRVRVVSSLNSAVAICIGGNIPRASAAVAPGNKRAYDVASEEGCDDVELATLVGGKMCNSG